MGVEPKMCEQCNGPLPVGSRASRRFCNKKCWAKWDWAHNKEARLVATRAWRVSTAESRKQARKDALPSIHCAECGQVVATYDRPTRRFCSKRCINRHAQRTRPGIKLAVNQRRRARIRGSGGPGVSDRDWRRLLNRFNGACAYCGSRERITRDHVVPISRGGLDAIGNLLPACLPCNSAKRDDYLVYWLRRTPSARLAA